MPYCYLHPDRDVYKFVRVGHIRLFVCKECYRKMYIESIYNQLTS
jgi:hypothetical protein